ncbi:MAG TPA: sugar phosphate nucleotidyltransferase [Chitinophagaceae bacterium]
MQSTLLILAAGVASRYGSMKQVEGFGPYQETIMDYSIYDAIQAGFDKVVFIIREEFAENFKAIFEPKLKGKISTDYVFQEMDSFLEGSPLPAGRTKPWGTAHAVLCARNAINGPFAVINADDFYGLDAFRKMAKFLQNECRDNQYGLVGYELGKTLSENGSVSRGVCEVDKNSNLESIKERTKITRENGQIIFEEADGSKRPLTPDTTVSMNFFGFAPSFFEWSQRLFKEFLEQNRENPKAEFFIPIVVDYFISHKVGTVQVLPTAAQWFGVTYKEDAPAVRNDLRALIAAGLYPEKLWP